MMGMGFATHALPPIAGREAKLLALVQHNKPVFLPQTTLNLPSQRNRG